MPVVMGKQFDCLHGFVWILDRDGMGFDTDVSENECNRKERI